MRQVRLRGPNVPCQLLERSSLGVVFAGKDPAVFLPSNSALFLEPYSGPLALWDQGPRETVHIETEIVQPAQIDVGGYLPQLQHP